MVKVFLSAGHGGKDPGAIGNGLREKDINLVIAKACAKYLDANGILVKLSREGDENDPVGEEVVEANHFYADIAISFHNNAGGGDGSETYYYANCEKGRELARRLENASIKLGQNSRGIKPTTNLYFLNKTAMPAVLVETAFIDNAGDISIIDTPKEQETFGRVYGQEILNYLNHNPTPNQAPKDTDLLIKAKVPLNIRKGPGVEYAIVGELDTSYKYTIVQTARALDGGTWGKLKSEAGWINISEKYVERYNNAG